MINFNLLKFFKKFDKMISFHKTQCLKKVYYNSTQLLLKTRMVANITKLFFDIKIKKKIKQNMRVFMKKLQNKMREETNNKNLNRSNFKKFFKIGNFCYKKLVEQNTKYNKLKKTIKKKYRNKTTFNKILFCLTRFSSCFFHIYEKNKKKNIYNLFYKQLFQNEKNIYIKILRHLYRKKKKRIEHYLIFKYSAQILFYKRLYSSRNFKRNYRFNDKNKSNQFTQYNNKKGFNYFKNPYGNIYQKMPKNYSFNKNKR